MNSAVDGGVVVNRMLEADGNIGFDAARNCYVDRFEAGPTKVVPTDMGSQRQRGQGPASYAAAPKIEPMDELLLKPFERVAHPKTIVRVAESEHISFNRSGSTSSNGQASTFTPVEAED